MPVQQTLGSSSQDFLEPPVTGGRSLSTDERRRYYRLTRFGKRVAAAEVERLSALVQQARATGLAPGA